MYWLIARLSGGLAINGMVGMLLMVLSWRKLTSGLIVIPRRLLILHRETERFGTHTDSFSFSFCGLRQISKLAVMSQFTLTETGEVSAVFEMKNFNVECHLLIFLMDIFTAMHWVSKTFFVAVFFFLWSVTYWQKVVQGFTYCCLLCVGTRMYCKFSGQQGVPLQREPLERLSQPGIG